MMMTIGPRQGKLPHHSIVSGPQYPTTRAASRVPPAMTTENHPIPLHSTHHMVARVSGRLSAVGTKPLNRLSTASHGTPTPDSTDESRE
jgi:hypothetical protein